MAIGIDAAADAIGRTASIPANSSFTVMVDAVVLSDAGSTTVQTLVHGFSAGLTDGFALLWSTNSPGSTMALASYSGGVPVASVLFASRPAIGSPFCAYVKCSGTGAGLLEAGWKYPGGPWVIGATTMSGSVSQIVNVLYGGLAGAYYTNSRVQNFKLWDVPLSAGELDKESRGVCVVNNRGLNVYAPCPHHNDVIDRGPLGRSLAKSGTLTTEYFSYPRSVKPKRPQVPYAVVASFNAGWARNANTIIQGAAL